MEAPGWDAVSLSIHVEARIFHHRKLLHLVSMAGQKSRCSGITSVSKLKLLPQQPDSLSLLLTLMSSCQIILQKSIRVGPRGPWQATYLQSPVAPCRTNASMTISSITWASCVSAEVISLCHPDEARIDVVRFGLCGQQGQHHATLVIYKHIMKSLGGTNTQLDHTN